MPKNHLTAKQRRLLQELDEISSLLKLDYHEIQRYGQLSRTYRLEYAKRHFVRGEVVLQYTLVDEFVSDILCGYFFGGKSYIRLWKTKRFRNFNYFIVEKLSLLEKFAFVRAIQVIPKPIVREIEQLNALRNGIAHAFYPENLKALKPKWKGASIFGLDGLRRFVGDMGTLTQFLRSKMSAANRG